MWLSRPNALLDGILLASGFGLVLSAIVITKGTSDGQSYLMPLCQEVVATVEKKGNVLAQCPAGTYIEINDGNVICRCGTHRTPIIEEPTLMFNDPMPTEPPEPAPELPHDDKSFWL